MEKEKKEQQTHVAMDPPDGGRGWLVVFGAFCVRHPPPEFSLFDSLYSFLGFVCNVNRISLSLFSWTDFFLVVMASITRGGCF